MSSALIKPQQLVLTDQDGVTRTYLISRFPAVPGRRIITQYPLSALPRLGDYAVNESQMMELMSYVAILIPSDDGEKEMRLTTRELINNHTGDWETLAKLEMAMFEYNCSFLQGERLSTSLEGWVQKALALISKMLMDSSAQSSPAGKPPITN